MDCDYYIIVALIVKHVKDNITHSHFIKIDKLKMYYMFIYGYDNTNNYTQLANNEIENVTKIYFNMDRTIYENRKWILQDKKFIMRYNTYLINNGIKLEDVINIQKKHYKMKKQLSILHPTIYLKN